MRIHNLSFVLDGGIDDDNRLYGDTQCVNIPRDLLFPSHRADQSIDSTQSIVHSRYAEECTLFIDFQQFNLLFSEALRFKIVQFTRENHRNHAFCSLLVFVEVT